MFLKSFLLYSDLIQVLSLFFLVTLTRGLSILFAVSKNYLLVLLIFSIVCILWYWVPLSFLLFPFFFFFLFIYYFFDYIRKDIQSWTVVKIVEIDFTQELTIIIGEKCLSAELVHSWPQTVWADGDVLSRSKERPVIEQY